MGSNYLQEILIRIYCLFNIYNQIIDENLNLNTAIPYKNWNNSPYEIVGWPLIDGFKEFKYFDINKKKII